MAEDTTHENMDNGHIAPETLGGGASMAARGAAGESYVGESAARCGKHENYVIHGC